MKFIKSLIVVLLTSSLVYAAGYYAPYGFRYIPQLTTQGTTDYNQIVVNETATDALLNTLNITNTKVAQFKMLGDTGYTTLAEAITTIGSTTTTLIVPSGAWVGGGVTVPANVTLSIVNGGYFTIANGTTLTINGPVEAEPYQIFSWTGTGAIDISLSPTPEVFIQWWGAAAGKTNDCTAALSKAFDSIGSQHNITFPEGIWRITSTITKGSTSTYTDRRYSLRGKDRHLSTLYIDVGAGNDGLFLAGAYFDIRDMSFIGPTGACRNGLVIGGGAGAILSMQRVNMVMGTAATGFALRLSGVVYGKIDDLDIGHYDGLYTVAPYNCVRATNGIAFMHPLGYVSGPGDYGNNAIDVLANISGMTAGYGIYMENAICVKIRGSIENCLWPFYVDGGATIDTQTMFNVQQVDLDDMYILDLNVNNLYIKRAQNITVNNCACDVGPAILTNTRAVSLKCSRFESLHIYPDCFGTVLDNVGVANVNGPLDRNYVDEAADTVCLTPVYSLYDIGTAMQPSNPPIAKNLLENAGFERWNTSVPDRWVEAAGAWAKESTVIHGTTYSAKANTNGQAMIQPTYTLSAEELKRVKGKVVTASIWIKFTGTPTTYGRLFLDAGTPPNWSVSSPVLGDVVKDVAATSSWRFKCVQAGTTGAVEPTWPTKLGREVTDGTVIWQAIAYPTGDQQLMSADSGNWRQISSSGFIPANATTTSIYLLLYKAAAADIDYYLSEPCLTVGGWAPNFYLSGRNEFTASGIQVEANKMTWGAGVPGASTGWHQQGDIHINSAASTGGIPGWICITSGADAAAVWEKMAANAPLP